MRKFFKGIVVFFLIAIIIGGLGYIGYSYFNLNNSSTAANMSMYSNDITTTNNSSMNMDSMPGMNMSGTGSMNMQNQESNAMIVDTVKGILSTKEGLDNAIAAFNSSLSSLTLDPYSPSSGTSQSESMVGMQMPTMPDTATTAEAATNSQNGTTTVNIYPENNNSAAMQSASVSATTMQGMGPSYDARKMEQLHKGLYKLSIGMQLLEQLNNNVLAQAEAVRTANTQNPFEFYSDQYTLVLENKSKLNKALNYINEAENLVNINPYISDNGLVYDKDRMMSIHESIFKLAEGVALLNQLNDGLVKQAIETSADAQSALNDSNMDAMVMTMPQDPAVSGILGNISMTSLLNITLVIFVVMFVLGMIGAISNLFKSPQNNAR